MAQLIDKAALVAEILKRIKKLSKEFQESETIQFSKIGQIYALENLNYFIDTLEVKGIDSWHLQEKEDIYDAVKDWSSQTFVCIMKDGSIQKFIGNLDEDYEGHINAHIYGANDDYDNVDDIVKWIEST